MIILSIADLHTPAVYKETVKECTQSVELQSTVRYFNRFMSELMAKEPEWIPDYLCICGDIASKAKGEEYQLAKELIKQLAKTCCLSDDYILMVPGNHDMNVSGMLEQKEHGGYKLKEKDKDAYLSAINNLLETKSKKRKEDDVKYISSIFGAYSDFRKEFINESIPYFTFPPEYIPPAVAYTCGYKVFEKNKTVFVELNSSWFDLPKLSARNAVRFGDLHIQWLYNEIKEMKQRGYYVVTMFHHSLRYLDLAEYQTRDPQFPVYDNIIDMSDLCLSGHEHGSKSKEPDMLGNTCQYILNGGFYSPDAHNRVMESCASLIKIDPYKEQLTIRRFAKGTDGQWHEGREAKTYSTLSHLKNEIILPSAVSPQLSNMLFFDSTDKIKLYQRIVLRYLGSDYKILETERAGKFKLQSTLEDNIIPLRYVIFLEMERAIPNDILNREPNEQLIVICMCRYEKETDKQNYLKLMREYKKDVLKQIMIFFSLLSADF